MKTPTDKQIAAYCVRVELASATYRLADHFQTLPEERRKKISQLIEKMIEPLQENFDNLIGDNWDELYSLEAGTE